MSVTNKRSFDRKIVENSEAVGNSFVAASSLDMLTILLLRINTERRKGGESAVRKTAASIEQVRAEVVRRCS
jgi:hypothetical protein